MAVPLPLSAEGSPLRQQKKHKRAMTRAKLPKKETVS